MAVETGERETRKALGNTVLPPFDATIPRRAAGAVPLSFTQRQLWFLQRIMPENPAYNIPTCVRIPGKLDLEALQRAVNEIVRRHEILRTRFAGSESEPEQVIEPELVITLELADLAGTAPVERDRALDSLLQQESRKTFDLERAPLLRVRLVRLGAEQHVLLVVMHHIIADGWSLSVFFKEMETLYGAFARGEDSPLPELPLQYGDYSLWEKRRWQEGDLRADLDYWKRNLRGAPDVLELPTDYPRPDRPKFEGARECFELTPRSVEGLKRLGREAAASFYMTILAAYALLLHRYSGQDEVLIGIPFANREHEEVQGLIGFFVNMLVMRVNLQGNPSFVELVKRVRQTALDGYEHQCLPFELLVEELKPDRNPNRNPLFQAIFCMISEETVAARNCAGWAPFAELDNHTFKFDTGATILQNSSGFTMRLGYNAELFHRDTFLRMKGHFQNLLDDIVSYPEAGISDIQMLLPEEREIMRQWQQTQTEYPRAERIEQIFQGQAKSNPHAPALLGPSITLTYEELDKAATRLGSRLRQLGVGPETVVGVCMERSWQLVVALLGVLKAGGAYLPLDPDYPLERLLFMLKDTNASMVLTQSSLLGGLPEVLRSSFRVIAYEEIAGTPDGVPQPAGTPDNLALVIYTSGSTGTPKGIGIPHRAVVRLVRNTNYLDLEPRDRMAQVSNPSFDAITFEVWGALLNGCCLVSMSKEEALDPRSLAARIRNDGITAMLLTTALFNQFAASEEASVLGELRYLFFGGEAADPTSVQEVLSYFPPRHLVHLYGPAENTTVSTWHRVLSVPSGSSTVPIGAPISNTEAYVLDRNMAAVPTGVIGELYVGGDGLARGYVNRPELTAENFVPNPFSASGSARLYRTGDLVRYTSKGVMEFVGRLDQQVKIHGFRIEPGEIESVLGKHPNVRESMVLVADIEGQRRLIACVVAKEGTDTNDLHQHLRDRLPSYMMPSRTALLDEFPLTNNGKVDRSRLLQQAMAVSDETRGNNYVAPRTELERTIAAIWSELLRIERVGVHDNIFDLGGHSLLLMQIHARMRRQLPSDGNIKVMDLFLYTTIDSLAQFIQRRESAAASI